MHTKNKETGYRGEQLAAGYLQDKGYTIIETNWGDKWGELDIVAKDGETLVFVEVKTKIGTSYGSPEEMANPRKIAQVQRIAESYCVINGYTTCPVRIDVVAVVLDIHGNPLRITHYESHYS